LLGPRAEQVMARDGEELAVVREYLKSTAPAEYR
jgi:hypothetical protein